MSFSLEEFAGLRRELINGVRGRLTTKQQERQQDEEPQQELALAATLGHVAGGRLQQPGVQEEDR